MNAPFVRFFHSVLLSVVCFSVSAESLENKFAADAGSTKVKEIAFVDAGIANPDTLIREIDPHVTVVFIDSQRDGVEQIAETLAARKDIDAIHILSHGRSGILDLGTTKLSAASMVSNHADEMAVIRGALSQNADILIYGCNFGQDTHGAKAVELLAMATGADVVASDNLTGAITLGGDWDMEIQSGTIETAQISAESWNGVLLPFSISPVDPPVLSGGTGVGATALWVNAGVFDPGVSDTAIDLRATVISGDPSTAVVFANFNDELVVRTQAIAEMTVRWEAFVAGTAIPQDTPISGDPVFLVQDVDGAGGVPESLETIAAHLTGLTSYTVENPTNLFVSKIDGTVRASGTQDIARENKNAWVSYG